MLQIPPPTLKELGIVSLPLLRLVMFRFMITFNLCFAMGTDGAGLSYSNQA